MSARELTSGKAERLDKLLAGADMSRSEARACVAAGRVSVDGAVVRDPSAKARAEQVTLDGHAIEAKRACCAMINKPAGVITATEDKRLPREFM